MHITESKVYMPEIEEIEGIEKDYVYSVIMVMIGKLIIHFVFLVSFSSFLKVFSVACSFGRPLPTAGKGGRSPLEKVLLS